MPDIHYVCLSDTHLGGEESLLTHLNATGTGIDPKKPSPVMIQLVGCLKDLISINENKKKPTLILSGDILELALTTTNNAAMVFECFIDLIMHSGEELFEKIIYIPGNHDHHFWETGRETQYANFISTLKPCSDLIIPWHTTNIFVEKDPNPLPSYFLTRLVGRFSHLQDFVVTMAYPNFGLIRDNGEKCVIFHHGHFIEPLYQGMSSLRNLIFTNREEPKQIWDIEAENFAWIDFFWSTMGRSGEVGSDIELIYEKMHDQKAFKKLLFTFADNLIKKHGLKHFPKFLQRGFLKLLFKVLAKKMAPPERKIKKPLSPKAKEGLQEYMQTPLLNQLINELKEDMPMDITFVFGHTHKPFQRIMNFEGYSNGIKVYNTGGWVVDSLEPHPIYGGAVILMDENLNTISLRMYNEANKPGDYSVKVEEVTLAGKEESLFYRKICDLIDTTKDPWKKFSFTTSEEVLKREKYLQDRINVKRGVRILKNTI